VHRAKGEDKGNIPGLSEECLYSLLFALCSVRFARSVSCAKKLMKAERNKAANTLRGTLLLRMATLDTLATQQRRHP
jgi:hypothetical protein